MYRANRVVGSRESLCRVTPPVAAFVGVCSLVIVSTHQLRAQARPVVPPAQAARCVAAAHRPSAARACALVIRYLRAELAGDVWTGSGSPDSAPGDSGQALGLPPSVNLLMSARASIDPRLCVAEVVGDTLNVLIQYGAVGTIANANLDGEYQFFSLGEPPYKWTVKEYRVVQDARGEWHVLFPSDPGDAQALIGTAAAAKVYEGRHLAQFILELRRAAAALKNLPRPPCPTFASWIPDSERPGI